MYDISSSCLRVVFFCVSFVFMFQLVSHRMSWRLQCQIGGIKIQCASHQDVEAISCLGKLHLLWLKCLCLRTHSCGPCACLDNSKFMEGLEGHLSYLSAPNNKINMCICSLALLFVISLLELMYHGISVGHHTPIKQHLCYLNW